MPFRNQWPYTGLGQVSEREGSRVPLQYSAPWGQSYGQTSGREMGLLGRARGEATTPSLTSQALAGLLATPQEAYPMPPQIPYTASNLQPMYAPGLGQVSERELGFNWEGPPLLFGENEHGPATYPGAGNWLTEQFSFLNPMQWNWGGGGQQFPNWTGSGGSKLMQSAPTSYGNYTSALTGPWNI